MRVRPSDPTPRGRRAAPAARAARLEARLVAGDEAGAWGVVDEALAAGTDPATVLTSVLAPAMRSIGERWAAGALTIADEHRASTVAARIVARLGPRFARPGRRRGTVVLGAPAGDRHALPSAILSDLLRGAGFDVVDLGADTPDQSFVDAAVEADRLVAVAVSVTAPDAVDGVPGTVRALRAAVPDAAVLVGGGAVPDGEAAHRLGSDAWAGTPEAVLDLFGSLARERLG